MDLVAVVVIPSLLHVNSLPEGFEKVAGDLRLLVNTNIHCAAESAPLPLEGIKLAGLGCVLCPVLSRLPVTTIDQVMWQGDPDM